MIEGFEEVLYRLYGIFLKVDSVVDLFIDFVCFVFPERFVFHSDRIKWLGNNDSHFLFSLIYPIRQASVLSRQPAIPTPTHLK